VVAWVRVIEQSEQFVRVIDISNENTVISANSQLISSTRSQGSETYGSICTRPWTAMCHNNSSSSPDLAEHFAKEKTKVRGLAKEKNSHSQKADCNS
jgi:hypothetical protein